MQFNSKLQIKSLFALQSQSNPFRVKNKNFIQRTGSHSNPCVISRVINPQLLYKPPLNNSFYHEHLYFYLL